VKYLLGTHIFLWLIAASKKLSPTIELAILEPTSELFLSPVSIWEAVLKNKIGKLTLPAPAADFLIDQRNRHGIRSLPIDDDTIRVFQSLAEHHKDPFDHIILSQAIQHGMILLTVDTVMQNYPVTILF
jgi:PIN domain nuclease of toxin-antitoxin system